MPAGTGAPLNVTFPETRPKFSPPHPIAKPARRMSEIRADQAARCGRSDILWRFLLERSSLAALNMKSGPSRPSYKRRCPRWQRAGIDETNFELGALLERHWLISVHARRHHVRGQVDGFANPLHGGVGHHELSAVS